MRVRCTATADYRSNAVGELELECTAEGLDVALRGVSSYREGYAPGPPVHARAVCIPWSAVYATRLGDRQLQLSVDSKNLPLNRFLLSDFAERPLDGADDHGGRLPYVLAAAALVAVGTCLWATRSLPHARAVGTLGWAALAVAATLSVIAWRARAAPRMPAHAVLDELCHDLARYVPHHISTAAPTPPPRPFEPAPLFALLPRSAVAIAITLAAATLAALIGSGAAKPRLAIFPPEAGGDPSPLLSIAAPLGGGASSSAPAPTRFESRPQASAELEIAQGAPVSPSGAAVDGACACARDESLPWQMPLARLSPVILSQDTRLHDGHEHTELELALVNDGSGEARQLSLSVLFFERRAGERAGQWQTGERSQLFAGPLAPGHAIRWHVEGRGTSFDVIAPDLGALAPDGSDAAPAEAYARLASGDDRALRLHAARMLAFLGDARAQTTARSLRASAPPAEADYLERLLEPPRVLTACELRVDRATTPWRVDACLFNRSDRVQTDLGVRLLAFDAGLDRMRPGARAPSLLGEHTAWLRASLPAHSGRRVELVAPMSLEMGSTPRAFELAVLPAGAPR